MHSRLCFSLNPLLNLSRDWGNHWCDSSVTHIVSTLPKGKVEVSFLQKISWFSRVCGRGNEMNNERKWSIYHLICFYFPHYA